MRKRDLGQIELRVKQLAQELAGLMLERKQVHKVLRRDILRTLPLVETY